MRLSLYDTEMNRIAIIGEHFVSCFWSEGYNTVEDFSMELQATDEYKKKVKTDYYVGRDDRKTLMVIKTVEVRDNLIVATGKQAARVLDDVPYIGTISANAEIPSAIQKAYDQFSHIYPNLSISSTGPSVSYPGQISNKSIRQLCEIMCQATDLGFRSVRSDGQILVEFYQPKENPNLIFSERFGNLDFKSLAHSVEKFKNAAIVLGAEIGSERISIPVDLSNGASLRILIIDARDIQIREDDTEETYRERMYSRGVEKLSSCNETLKCVFSPLASDFGTRYDLGDILTVLLPDHGMKLKARVARFTQVSQNNITETSVEVGKITILR